MKTTLKKILLLPIFFIAILFTGCQDELNEVIQGSDEEEILVAESNVASLMKFTTTKDGSKDNIIDKSSCFNILLPVNVFVNGLEIIVDSEDDFEVIENLFDKYYDDEDYLEYVFPITIVMADYTEIIIENEEQIENYIEECSNQEEDEDIECVDFIYPLTYSVFNKDDNLFNTVEIHSDREMYRFINKLTTNDVVSLDFPITLVYSNGDESIINNMLELEAALEAGAEFCDEDDDNDYGDDDFTKERLDNLLVLCPWIVHDVRRNDDSLTDKYREYVVVFKENGIAKIRARNGDIITGSWITRVTDRGVKIKLEFDSFADFTLEWFVHDIDYGRIKLIIEGGNRIVLEKKCDAVFDHNIERVENILKKCLWRVSRLHIDGTDNEKRFIGTPLKFFNDGIVKLRINGEFIEGQWDIIEADLGALILKINFDNYPNLNLHWRISALGEEVIKLQNESSEMILKRACPNTDEDVNYIIDVVTNGIWSVALYETESGNMTEEYIGYVLGFEESGKIFGEGNGENIFGSWISYRNDGKLRLGLNFEHQAPFDDFNYRWKVLEISTNRVKLVDFDSNGAIERTLVLEKEE